MHVGVLIPANNTTVERELPYWLPTGSTLEIARIPRGQGLLDAQSLPAYKAAAMTVAEAFADDRIDRVAYACTAASFIMGPAGDAALAGQLGTITGKPIATIAQSMIAALHRRGVRRIALVTPYSMAVNEQLTAYLASGGIEVGAFDGFYAADVAALAAITADDVSRLARATMADDCEAMFIACAQLPTAAILDGLEAAMGRPVLSSVQTLGEALAQRIRSATPSSEASGTRSKTEVVGTYSSPTDPV